MSTSIKGIDVSKWQGTIDWAKVAGDGVKFAMIRLGYGGKGGAACGVDNFYQKMSRALSRTGSPSAAIFTVTPSPWRP